MLQEHTPGAEQFPPFWQEGEQTAKETNVFQLR